MEYLKNTPIRFTAPKGGWPTDWEKEPLSGECVDAINGSDLETIQDEIPLLMGRLTKNGIEWER